jgi:peptidoglycan/xylan/chitin deacetylase (PgdA/CDA1 family)
MHVLRRFWEKNWPQVHAAMSGGLPQFVLGRRVRGLDTGVPAFCYHIVQTEAFEADLAFLSRNGYVTIDADALLGHLEGRRPAPRQAVVLSIDDGARNLYDVAFPLLRRYGMTAVAFVAPAFHEEPSTTVDEEQRPCTWQELREMHSSGHVDIQSHTFSHRLVTRWPAPAELLGCSASTAERLRGAPLTLAEDLRLAKAIIEEKLGKNIRHLAFPQYRGTQEALRLGRACGYRGFWWGTLPGRPDNRPRQGADRIARLNGDLLRRLPGDGRRSLLDIVGARSIASARRIAAPARQDR